MTKSNKRIFTEKNFNEQSSLTCKELRQLLKQEKREEDSKVIKEVLYNKFFARIIFVICIGLNLLFVTLGILNYLNIIG